MSTEAGGSGGSRLRASTEAEGSGAVTSRFDLDRAWCVDDRVAVRPEPFGALLYHFGTRRLSFLKNTTVLDVVQSLADHPSARSACTAAGVGAAALPAYERALATLAESRMIRERPGSASAVSAIAGSAGTGPESTGS